VEQDAGRDLVLASDRLQVEGDAERRVLGDDTTVVGGAATVEADEIILRARQRIVLEVGGNRVLLDGAGIAVEASAGTVTITGAEEVATDAPHVRIRGGATVEIEASGQIKASAGVIRLN
jgi:hypothetical protein